MNLMGDAIKASQRGFHIFPVQDNEKTPHVTSPPYTLKWSDVATRDLRTIVNWWTTWPFSNIGVACKPSGLLVVDCDTPKRAGQLVGTRWEYLHELLGPMVDGECVFDAVCQRYGGGDWGTTADTYVVATGSGGRHYYYRWPEGVRASQASLVRGVLDIRCNGGDRGGYVLGEGSRTSSGDYVRVGDAPVRPAPDWLVSICTEQPRLAAPSREYERPGVLNYGGLADAVLYAPEGNRNNCLLWAARSMCTDGATEEEAQEVLGEAAQVNGLTSTEVRDTIRSAYRLQRSRT